MNFQMDDLLKFLSNVYYESVNFTEFNASTGLFVFDLDMIDYDTSTPQMLTTRLNELGDDEVDRIIVSKTFQIYGMRHLVSVSI